MTIARPSASVCTCRDMPIDMGGSGGCNFGSYVSCSGCIGPRLRSEDDIFL